MERKKSAARWELFVTEEKFEGYWYSRDHLSKETGYRRMLVELSRKDAFQSPAKCVKECVLRKGSHVHDDSTRMNIVESRFVREVLVPTLSLRQVAK